MISKSPSPLHPPVYSTLKDLHLTTELIRDARPAVTIVIPQDGSYDSQADQLQKSIETISGVKVPVATDLSEFVKAGGSAKCLTLRLDGEEAANWKYDASRASA